MKKLVSLALVVMAYAIITNPPDGSGVQFRGSALDAWRYKGSEVLLAGPAETGKTFALCNKLHALCCKYPGSQNALIRQVQSDMYGSVLKTWESVIKLAIENKAVRAFGGEHPDFYQYWNGSRVWIGGMDRPGKVLSSERDFIYICQAEELTQDGYEHITTRCTGRAANAPYHQIMMDCNPSHSKHFLLQRAKLGLLKILESRHEDNPTLFNLSTQTWTARGIETMRILDALTGVRKQRLRFGRWVGAEGLVYERFDRAIHCIDRFEVPSDWYRYLAVDWGYRDPMVVQWWATNGERAFRYREIYITGQRVEVVAKRVKDLSACEKIQYAVTDHEPEKRATFEDYSGIETVRAQKAIDVGIQAVERQLELDPDGKPYIAFLKDSLVEADESLLMSGLPICTEDEFDCYIWHKDQEGKARKESPVDANNHGMDATRYFVMEWRDPVNAPIEMRI